MRLTVLGGSGAYPAAGQACSGYLVEHDGFRLLVDPGYAVVPRLLAHCTVDQVDAVFVSHGHPDHCADLNPLLRARALGPTGALPALPVHSLPGALNAVLALDRPGMLDAAFARHEFTAGDSFEIGPFQLSTALLPHSLPNAGLRLTTAGRALAYTGDSGPDEAVVDLARGVDLLLAEASQVDGVPPGTESTLTDAVTAGQQAARAGVGQLVLTHLFPGTDPEEASAAAGRSYSGPIAVARPDLQLDLD